MDIPVKAAPLVLLALLGVVPCAAQEAADGAPEVVGGLAFADEVEVTVVNVDVFVRDRKGRPVRGLGAADFVVRQNGVEMPITNFVELNEEVIRHRVTELEERSARMPGAPPPDDGLEIKPIRVVLYVDNENIGSLDRNRVLRRVREFVSANLDEPVEMMVASFHRSLKVVQPFTTDAGAVNGALRGMAKLVGAREEMESTRRDLIEAMIDARNQDYGTSHNSQAGAKLDMRQRVAAYAREEAENLRLALSGLRQMIAMLSGIEGRKSIIYISSGLPMEPGMGLMHDYAMTFHDQSILSLRGRYDGTRYFKELTSFANAQEVSLYSIDAEGLNPLAGMDAESSYSRDPTASSIGARNYRSSLIYMAEATGGIAVTNTNDVVGGLELISRDLYNYYSLGYTVNPSGTDRVHRIEVEIANGGDYDLRYRRRFVEKSHESRVQDRVFTSLVVDIDDNPMAVELAPGGIVRGSETEWIAPVHLSFDLGAIALMPVGEELVGRVVVFIGSRDEHGRNSEVLRQEHEIRLPKRQYEASDKRRYGIDFRLLVPAGRNRVAVGVMDPITRQASYARTVVTVR